ncbi:mCG142108 [Mus musculus]|nr:mCG142108 [Mus musculus]
MTETDLSENNIQPRDSRWLLFHLSWDLDGLELHILLLRTPECGDYSHTEPHPLVLK